MKRILITYDRKLATAAIVEEMLLDFCPRYDCKLIACQTSDLKESQICDSDVIICIRGESPLMYSILLKAKTAQKKILFYLDDDLKDTPKGSFRYAGRKKWLIKCLKASDVLLTCSELIANEYAAYLPGGRTAIVHTVVKEDELLPVEGGVAAGRVEPPVKIVYAAGERHITFYNRYVRRPLDRILQSYGGKVELTFIGMDPSIEKSDGAHNRYHYVPAMPLHKYQEYMTAHHFDIGLAPLESNHFTARKYFNKFIEYSKFGICGVYSRLNPYLLVVKDKVNGYLAENTDGAWEGAIRRAIENRPERVKCVEQAQDYLRARHSSERIYARLVKDVPELLSYDSPGVTRLIRTDSLAVRHVVFRLCEKLYLGCYSLLHYGLRRTVKRMMHNA